MAPWRCGAIVNAIATAKGGGWISVKDALPDVGKAILAYRPMAAETNDPVLAITFLRSATSLSLSPQGVAHGFDC